MDIGPCIGTISSVSRCPIKADIGSVVAAIRDIFAIMSNQHIRRLIELSSDSIYHILALSIYLCGIFSYFFSPRSFDHAFLCPDLSIIIRMDRSMFCFA